MSFLRWEVAAVQQLTPTVTAASAALPPAAQRETRPVFLKKILDYQSKAFFFFFFAAELCLERVYLLLCKKVVRNLLVLHAAALLPRKPPGPGDEASAIFLVSL